MGRIHTADDLVDLSRIEAKQELRRIADDYIRDTRSRSSTPSDSSSDSEARLVYRDKALLEFLKRREG